MPTDADGLHRYHGEAAVDAGPAGQRWVSGGTVADSAVDNLFDLGGRLVANSKACGRRLLVWDAPNMDMCLSEVIGEKATIATRPDMGAVLRWFVERAMAGDNVEACVFANVARGMEAPIAGWVANLRHLGFSVFVKPKQHRRDDVDVEMLRHIERRAAQPSLVELVVASHDAKAFADPLTRHARNGVRTTVMGYRERDVFASDSGVIDFVDVEDVPGAFGRPLPRTNLYDLPSGGKWFSPFVEIVVPDEPEPAEVPDRAAIVESVIEAVDGAAADGRGGLTLAEVGELVRNRWPRLRLEDAGFAGVAELLDALEATGSVRVQRDGDGPRVLVPVVIDLVADEPPVPDGPTNEPDPDPEPVEAHAGAGSGAAAANTGATSNAAASATPDMTAESMPSDPTGSNAIYRMFRYEPPAAS